MMLKQKELVEEVRGEWKKLWCERIDDKVRAEGIATNNYSNLFIDKGTIIHATRDFKALNLKDILEQHQIENAQRYINPDPHIGGWTKFVKENITKQAKKSKKIEYHCFADKEKQHLKQNGRGWLHK